MCQKLGSVSPYNRKIRLGPYNRKLSSLCLILKMINFDKISHVNNKIQSSNRILNIGGSASGKKPY